MPKHHRKCDSSKFRRLQKSQHIRHLAKVKRLKEIERKDQIRIAQWRRDHEEMLQHQREIRQRLLNLLTFRMWRLDPEEYDRWARWRRFNSITSLFGRTI